ncbi:hypothetical protein F4780DRAFT_790006 [Xylariomycetidae sp. FL0641]|nr:hypothetical protein F4780DRAFT_790006 [Xylariomycetidae sp. FL0641]
MSEDPATPPTSPVYAAFVAALDWTTGHPILDEHLLAPNIEDVVAKFLGDVEGISQYIQRKPPMLNTYILGNAYLDYLPDHVLACRANEIENQLTVLWGEPIIHLVRYYKGVQGSILSEGFRNRLAIVVIICSTYVYSTVFFREVTYGHFKRVPSRFSQEVSERLSRRIFQLPDEYISPIPSQSSEWDLDWLELRMGERVVEALIGGIFEVWQPAGGPLSEINRTGFVGIDLVIREIDELGEPMPRVYRITDAWFREVFSICDWIKPTSEYLEPFSGDSEEYSQEDSEY